MGAHTSASHKAEMVATEMLPIFFLAGVSNVLGHGGMVWPPTWQDGYALPLDEVWNNMIEGNPPMKDNATGKWINNAKSWLTDQSYTGGHGEFLKTLGHVRIRSILGRSLVMQLNLVKVAESMVATPWDALSTEKLQTTASQVLCAFQTQTSIAGPGLTAAEPLT